MLTRDIRRRAWLVLLVAAMVASAFTVGVFVGRRYASVARSTARRQSESAVDREPMFIIVQQRGAKQRLTSTLSERLGDEIAKIPGVKQVDTGLVEFVDLEDMGISAAMVQGWIPDSALMRTLSVAPGGRRLMATDRHGVLLGDELAKALEKKVGDTMPLFDGTYTIVGIVQGANLSESNGMWVSLADLQKSLKREGQVTGYKVTVNRPYDEADVRRIRTRIAALGKDIVARIETDSRGANHDHYHQGQPEK
jgi:putative ABC transport system permease protein